MDTAYQNGTMEKGARMALSAMRAYQQGVPLIKY
jgi:hypothetical protein